MKKVLIVGLGNQGQKYVNYFLKNNYKTFGVCKTQGTKNYIKYKYGIEVYLDYKALNYNSFDIIIISLPPDIQAEISLEILKIGFINKMIIEIPVTWDKSKLEELKKYDNVIFFLEEYYTLLSKFLRKIDLKKISKIDISITTSKEDFINKKAKKVTMIHINNNFLGIKLDKKLINYNFDFHNSENIYYKILIIYNSKKIIYNFDQQKYLIIEGKKYIDKYNFDFVLNNIININNNFSKYYNP